MEHKFKINEKQYLEIYSEVISNIPKILEISDKAVKEDSRIHKDNIEYLKFKARILQQALGFLQGKWTLEICFIIMTQKSCRFNELKSMLPSNNNKTITSRVLTDRLRMLEKRGIIYREVIGESPVQVKYLITDLGYKISSLFIPLFVFLKQYYQ
ncbi:MAG: winged helix-turn-helix transcriptional regulator [Promethearchaeota archaeon]